MPLMTASFPRRQGHAKPHWKPAVLTLIVLGIPSPSAADGTCADAAWVTAWTAPPSSMAQGLHLFGPNQTFREIISPLGEGCTLRLRLSNRYGHRPAVFSTVRLARQAVGAAIVTGSSTPVLFNGRTSLVIPAGKEAFSDPVQFKFQALEHLAVSMAIKDTGGLPTSHADARQYSYMTYPGTGAHADDMGGDAFVQRTTSRHYIIGMDALAPSGTPAVVALGSSTTNGAQMENLLRANSTTIGLDTRYPDFLKRKLDALGIPAFLANAGISGNQVTAEPPLMGLFAGPSALARLDKDVLSLSGVKTVILFEGMNDITSAIVLKGKSPGEITQTLIAGYTTLIRRLQDQGIRVIHATLTPIGNSAIYTLSDRKAALLKQARHDVNAWIRHQSPAEGMADFDAAIRDPLHPEALAAAYDGGDGQHFSPAGNQRLADEVNLQLLQAVRCP